MKTPHPQPWPPHAAWAQLSPEERERRFAKAWKGIALAWGITLDELKRRLGQEKR